jgi:hypothetical protein
VPFGALGAGEKAEVFEAAQVLVELFVCPVETWSVSLSVT